MEQQSDANLQNETGDSKKSKKPSPAIIICIILLIVVIGLLLVIFFLRKEPEEEDLGGRGTLATEDNVEDLIAEVERNTDAAYTVSMNIDWNFEDGTSSSSNAYVENDISNSRTVYFDLILADTSEVVYSSPYIPLGSTLTDFALDKDLDAGDYLAIVEYHLVDDEHNEISTVSVTVTLHILN